MATALITFILANNAYSTPILPYPPFNATSLSINISEACNDLRNCRTMWNLVYSCLLTIFTCVWTAVHPNVVEGDRGDMNLEDEIMRNDRFGLMRSSLIFPELVVAMAWNEFSEAWKLSRECKNVEGWTLVHSYFLRMGGFIDPTTHFFRRYDSSSLGQYPGIIQKTGNRQVVAVTKQELLHKSKGDPLSKSIVSLQLLWFIAQYVGRGVEHLHRSQLETVTLGYCVLSIVICALWWHKPLDVRSPIQVTKEDPAQLLTSEANVARVPLEVENEADSPPLTAKVIGRVCDAFAELEEFWILVITGAIFGGIHCSAWSFPFPTHAESLIWRICAVYITVAPALGPGAVEILTSTRFQSYQFHGDRVFGLAAATIYVVARIILFVLTFASLRSPSASLYRTPSWSSFIPHLG
ncbi:uncharacterized protein EI90DRAFT_2941737 [Cantharellus anzutake]|uniref:uncharacterized protein n=1 Tax=Cantharellus anzutake TaxID=1750568 RepID=UPI001907A929|nr:uncharacterized protein EI90DRAFT_2941737 [Cantharellus anzutake]KAF8318574.1 hypothetical protein EI90DRAFT_2941737 [Cantharellus anzutake]